MTIMPLAQYLTDFGTDRDARPSTEVGLGAAPETLGLITIEQHTAELEQAHAQGLEDGRIASEHACEEKLFQQKQAFQTQLAQERQVWAGDTGERLAQNLKDGLANIAKDLAESSVQILTPFLAGRIRERALSDIQENLKVLLAKNDVLTIDIAGPEDLLAELRHQLADVTAKTNYRTDNTTDVRISVDQTILETRISDWLAALNECSR